MRPRPKNRTNQKSTKGIEMKALFTFAVLTIFAGVTFAQTQNEQHSAQQSNQETQTKSTLTEADQLQIAVQKICPVIGAELGSMGDPIKVKIGEQVAFLCCKACQGKKVSADHWKTIQTRIAKAQGICPIMEKPVDSSMKSTVVNGQQVFVCCPPCIPKIEADVDGSLKKVNAKYVSFVASERQAESDQLHTQAQGICPVSGKKLGSMGDPIKVKVGNEEHAFLCCKGCVGKQINAEHWKTIQSNLAKAQGVCPVMEQPVDAEMKSVVVNGRKIFVCCPPCIAKIKADPATYVAKLDEQVANNGKPRVPAENHDHSGGSYSKHNK